jgi:anaerobic C4-dicarboxylate transporter DcuA
MLILEIIILFGAIYLGAKMGSMGIGFAGGVGSGSLILTVGLGLKPGSIPIDVILIIIA